MYVSLVFKYPNVNLNLCGWSTTCGRRSWEYAWQKYRNETLCTSYIPNILLENVSATNWSWRQSTIRIRCCIVLINWHLCTNVSNCCNDNASNSVTVSLFEENFEKRRPTAARFMYRNSDFCNQRYCGVILL